MGSDEHIFISMFASYVGLDPRKDINWVVNPHVECLERLLAGSIDAFFCGPPQSLEMRERKIGHVLVSTTVDKPWSHHTCCLVASNRDFVGQHPVATKRALRGILRAIDICAAEPARAAKIVTERGWAPYNNNLQMLRELPYGKWREFDPEDALRFYALRMRELGMIKSAPNKIIAEGTDWRFLNALKKELKA
jgi:NitT/TauT family transport system substrate-binding protein